VLALENGHARKPVGPQCADPICLLDCAAAELSGEQCAPDGEIATWTIQRVLYKRVAPEIADTDQVPS
jgi:hypothetical protein